HPYGFVASNPTSNVDVTGEILWDHLPRCLAGGYRNILEGDGGYYLMSCLAWMLSDGYLGEWPTVPQPTPPPPPPPPPPTPPQCHQTAACQNYYLQRDCDGFGICVADCLKARGYEGNQGDWAIRYARACREGLGGS